MFFSRPRRKPNKAHFRKAIGDSTSVPLDQTISVGQTKETVIDSNMSETDIETQALSNIKPSNTSKTEINIIANADTLFPVWIKVTAPYNAE